MNKNNETYLYLKDILLGRTFKSGNVYELGIYFYSLNRNTGDINEIVISNTEYSVAVEEHPYSMFTIQFYVKSKKQPYYKEAHSKEEVSDYIGQMFKSNGINL